MSYDFVDSREVSTAQSFGVKDPAGFALLGRTQIFVSLGNR
jgi:hypothetical protein